MNTEKESKQYGEHIDPLKISAPEGLGRSVLSFIERKEAQRKIFIKRITSAAAVIMVIVSTIFIVPRQSSQEMDYGDKLSALVEANKLFPETEDEIAEQDIIYEDESLIIYLK